METTNKLFYSGTKFFTENEEDYRITVRISLDDDCKNNICDWSITADVDWKNKHGKYEDYLGGCCHMASPVLLLRPLRQPLGNRLMRVWVRRKSW